MCCCHFLTVDQVEILQAIMGEDDTTTLSCEKNSCGWQSCTSPTSQPSNKLLSLCPDAHTPGHVQHQIRSWLLTEWWKRPNILLYWNHSSSVYCLQKPVTVTPGIANSTRTELFQISTLTESNSQSKQSQKVELWAGVVTYIKDWLLSAGFFFFQRIVSIEDIQSMNERGHTLFNTRPGKALVCLTFNCTYIAMEFIKWRSTHLHHVHFQCIAGDPESPHRF